MHVKASRLKWLSLLAVALLAAVAVFQTWRLVPRSSGMIIPGSEGPLDIPEVIKKDCQRLVEGQLLFEPAPTMRQGQAYSVYARLIRNPGVNIRQGLDGSQFVIEKAQVSCRIGMNLDSNESDAFLIEELPKGRKDDQLLEPDKFSQWDWRVTPKKHGTLHLLLYVTPLLYVDGISDPLPKRVGQPPRIITVTPDYWYGFTAYVAENWAVISGLLTLIVIPLFLWSRTAIMDWIKKRFEKNDVFYPLPPPKGGNG